MLPMGVSEENNASFSVGYNEVHKKDGGKLICIKFKLQTFVTHPPIVLQ